MNKLSELPFISISKENLMAAADMLDREQMGEVMEMIIDAVLNDGQPSSDNKCVNGVFKQFMAVIERKSSSYFGRKKHIDKVNEAKKQRAEEERATTTTQPVEDYDPTFDNCIQTLQMVRAEKGDYRMEAEANRLSREYGYSVKDLCETAKTLTTF